MSDVAIRVEGLGKQYHLGAQQERYHTFADQIRNWTSVRKLFSRAKRAESRPPFWALKDVSFEVKRGEVVGIIGRNGAGKSTLLKILSRITEPTEGGADIHGRVGSLLEVGTGFHPELTGRENVYLNGAILGMKRSEIVRKFDEIVAFAEVEKFIDTPVKHYSSGMYMRLAFAVAAHLDPEILVVDEVLAVGDAQFQKKCLGKMGEVAKGGRTVLFVSHQMENIRRLCGRVIWLASGRTLRDDEPSKVIQEYLTESTIETKPGRRVDLTSARREGSGEARFSSVCYIGSREGMWPHTGGPMTVKVEIVATNELTADSLAVTVYDLSGFKLVNADTTIYSEDIRLTPGRTTIDIQFEAIHLNPGEYRVGFWLARRSGTVLDHIESAFQLSISPDVGQLAKPIVPGDGVVSCQFKYAIVEHSTIAKDSLL